MQWPRAQARCLTHSALAGRAPRHALAASPPAGAQLGAAQHRNTRLSVHLKMPRIPTSLHLLHL